MTDENKRMSVRNSALDELVAYAEQLRWQDGQPPTLLSIACQLDKIVESLQAERI